MIKKIKNFFNKFSKKKINPLITEIYTEIELLENYDFKNMCNQCNIEIIKKEKKFCEKWLKNYDPNKKTFIIIDDNKGIISIIKDILEELDSEGKISLKNWNILSFTTKQAGIFLLKPILKKMFKSVDAALIDITFGNILRINNKNIKINGLHIAYFLKKYYNTKFYFYTGNTLNDYIKNQKMLKEFFKKELQKNLDDYVIHKNLDSEDVLKNKLIELFKD